MKESKYVLEYIDYGKEKNRSYPWNIKIISERSRINEFDLNPENNINIWECIAVGHSSTKYEKFIEIVMKEQKRKLLSGRLTTNDIRRLWILYEIQYEIGIKDKNIILSSLFKKSI